jgi:hypothetical protein
MVAGMSKFTPGEWLVDGATVYALQDCVWLGLPTKENRFSANVQGKAPEEELIANAHLIAAAPDMYEALEDLSRAYRALMKRSGYDQSDIADSDSLEIADASLKKARGEI